MAYWELRAEQVLNRVFEPEKPIEVEFCDSPRQAPLQAVEPTLVINPLPSHRAKPGLLLAVTSGAVVVATGAALVVLGLWNQSQQAIQQERNMLLIERLRNMGPSSGAATSQATAQANSAAAQAANIAAQQAAQANAAAAATAAAAKQRERMVQYPRPQSTDTTPAGSSGVLSVKPQ